MAMKFMTLSVRRAINSSAGASSSLSSAGRSSSAAFDYFGAALVARPTRQMFTHGCQANWGTRQLTISLTLFSLRWVLHQNICKCSAQGSERDRGRIGGGTHAVCKLLDGCRLTNATANNDAVGGAFLSAFL